MSLDAEEIGKDIGGRDGAYSISHSGIASREFGRTVATYDVFHPRGGSKWDGAPLSGTHFGGDAPQLRLRVPA